MRNGEQFMNTKIYRRGSLLFGMLVVSSLVPAALRAAEHSAPAASDPSAVVMTVTATAKKDAQPPAITKNDVELYRGKERVQVADLKRGETLYLAVLVDDSLRSSLANQWSDLRAFLMAQPQTTYIAVAYARNGVVMVAQDFTTDHALAAKALRMPLATPELQPAHISPFRIGSNVGPPPENAVPSSCSLRALIIFVEVPRLLIPISI